MFYLPVLLLPDETEDRATGFLIPAYGSSTRRAASRFHNAFFWAIDRSQDATVLPRLVSRRPARASAANTATTSAAATTGRSSAYLLERARHHSRWTRTAPTGRVRRSRSYEIRGGANQLLPGHLRARAASTIFPSIATSQTLNTNIYDISRNQRDFGGNVGRRVRNILAERHHRSHASISLATATSSTLSGNWPRIGVTRNERPLAGHAAVFLGSAASTSTSSRSSTRHERCRNRTRGASGRVDFAPAGPVSVQEMAVVHGQQHGRLAGHLLYAQPVCEGQFNRRTGRHDDEPQSARLSPLKREHPRAGLQPHLGHA